MVNASGDMHHYVLVISSAGNNEDGTHCISATGMAYNGITVGAYDDKGTADHSDDVLWSHSSYVDIESDTDNDSNNDGDIIPHAEKPDLIAPGVGIAIPGLADNNTGNVEIVKFKPGVTGNYTIKIKKIGQYNEKEFVYLAWW